MATANRVLQLLRSSSVYESKSAAITAVSAMTGADGEIRLARYSVGTYSEGVNEGKAIIKSLLCVYHASPSLETGNVAGWTFIEDASSSEGSSAALQAEVDAIETAVGLANNGTYVTPTGTNYLNSTTSVMNALGALDTAVDGIQDTIDGLAMNENYGTNAPTSDGKVITAVKQVDGQVSALSADFSDVKIAGYTKNANATGALAATDSLEDALSKLENTIAANNTANTVSSSDQSITVATASTGTDVIVNVDNATIVKDGNSGAIKSALKVIKVIPSGTAGTDEVVDATLGTNVKEAYRLVYDGSTTAIGQQVNVYKDSALKEVYLGASTDTVDASTGVVTKNTVTDPQSMNFVYQLADGTYSITKIDVSKFLTDSEFGDGLQVSGGVVSVKKDANSGKVRIADVPTGETEGSAADTGLVDVLTVSSNGVKVDNIQAAINYAVQNASSDLAVSAAGDSVYIAAAVDASDNKKINVTGTYGAFNTPTAGANTLSATTNGIAKAEDVATAVNTVVGNLDGSATATAASGDVYTVLTSVTETDGVIAKGGEVTLAAVAKTGAAADVSYTNTTSGLTATNVQAAIDEVEGRVDSLETTAGGALQSISAGDTSITVGTEDANHNQTVAVNFSNAADNVLGLDSTNGGVYLSNVWDCGTY